MSLPFTVIISFSTPYHLEIEAKLTISPLVLKIDPGKPSLHCYQE